MLALGLDKPLPSCNTSAMTDSNAAERFLTYRYYLRALAGLAGFGHPTVASESVYPALSQRITAMDSLGHRSKSDCDKQTLKRSLMNAWGTELLLSLSGEYAVDDELLRVTNNWSAVQLYYVFYHATQALIVARGGERPDSHPKTLKLFMDMWTMRPLQCLPWTLGHGSSPQNLPVGHQAESRLSTLARPRSEADFVNYTLKALYTTRKEALPNALRTKREGKRKLLRQAWESAENERLRDGKRARSRPEFPLPILTAEEKAVAQNAVRCHTIMDLLWRLRTRTNYRDGLMFIEGPADEEVSRDAHLDMRHVAESTMLLYEMHICRRIGPDAMRELADEWLERNRFSAKRGVGQRLALVLSQ